LINGLIRKTRQAASDPVLRNWLWRRVTGGVRGPLAFTAHRPSYLKDYSATPASPPAPPIAFRSLTSPPPTGPIKLPLAGTILELKPGDETNVFSRTFDDIETLLALHRFAWVPLVAGGGNTASWVQALWDQWRKTFSEPDKSWAWHPYTATERVINILDLALNKGLPDPVDETLTLLARHANAIQGRLEYFGDHNTSNHLSNNGRGLYRLGLALGLEWAADTGAKILEEEAKRIFLPSGMLREGSSHYHFLLTRNYADAWLAARRHGRAEEGALRDITERALSVIPWLVLPGGLPIIGDASPDCPPEFLLGLTGAEIGWMRQLPKDDRAALSALIADVGPANAEALLADGWLRLRHGPWAGLWHTAPGGWSHSPGHGHQDAGGFELHFHDLPVFVDPGRGKYGENGEATHYRSSLVHNTLTIDGAESYPVNKPYYDDAFRRDIAGPPPEITGGGDEVVVVHQGFQRLKGVGALRRQWRFTENAMVLNDSLEGDGSHSLTRRLVTPLDAEAGAGGIILKGGNKTFHLNSPDTAPVVSKTTLWRAYGNGKPGYAIDFTDKATLPWSGEIRLEVL